MLIAICASANPFLGKWLVDAVYLEKPVIFEFYENQIYTFTELESNETEYKQYRWEEGNTLLDLGEINGTPLVTRYEFISPKFILYFHDEASDWIAEQMKLDSSEDENANAVSKNFGIALGKE